MNMDTVRPEGKKIRKIKVKLLEMHEEELAITTPFIRLDAALKFSGLAETGGHAKILIEEGRVRVNGEVCTQRGKKIRPGDDVCIDGMHFTVSYAD